MKKNLFLVLIAVLCVIQTWAATFSGKVTNEKGSALSYVSVYLKGQPEVGTITDENGIYSLEVNFAHSDELIFSLIGYQQQQIKVASGTQNRTIDVKLKEQPIMLHGVTIAPPLEKSKKWKKKEKQALLERIYAQMKIDFPNKPITYRVVSDMTTRNEYDILHFEEIVASIKELPNYHKNGIDSVAMKVESVKNFVEPKFENSLSKVDLNAFSKKEKKMIKGVPSTETEDLTSVHKMLWTLDVERLLTRCYQETSRWEIVEKGNRYLLTYKRSRNAVGVVKLTQTLVLEVRRDNCRLLNLSEKLKIDVNIPFGYKFSEGDLQILNSLTLGRTSFEKYKLKRMSATTTRNAIFARESTRNVVKEKSFEATGFIEDNKDNRVVFNNKSKINVLKSTY